jgi:TPR repeat protein
LKDKREQLEERWFMPYTLNVDKKRVYQMHLEPTKIIYPEEFRSVIDEIPLADDYVDMSRYVSEEMKKEENEILLKGAQMGDIKCMNQLARAYYNGIGRIADKSKAFSLWKKTADMGDAEGLYYMGVFYGTGDVVSQDCTISIQYLQKSADLGYADALYQLGVYKMHGFGCQVNWKEALKFCEAAANKGCADAANEAGYIYDRGEHGVKKDDEKAFEWFLKAAELNHTEAIRYVIRAYHDGIVEDEDGEEYLYWVEKGFELDIPEVYLQVGFYLFQDKEYESAFPALAAASEKGLIVANHILALMLIKGLGVEQDVDEAIDYLTQGAYEGDESCLNLLQKIRPELWKKINSKFEDVLDMRSALISLVSDMEPKGNQNYILDIINAYRERFNEDYQKELNKQLNIHKPSTDENNGSRRKIVVRKSSSKKARYEIVIILANGEEQIIKLNPNSLVLLLLTIICSFKSGYNTVMALDTTCRSVMAELVRLVFRRVSEGAALEYVWKYMTSPKTGTDSYKTYSNFAKQSIVDAIGEYDDAIHFLFDNNETIGKRPLRSMNIDVNDIVLPKELRLLSQQMPDGKEILYSLEDEVVIAE